MPIIAHESPPETQLKHPSPGASINDIFDGIDAAQERMAACGRVGDGPGYRQAEANWDAWHDAWDAHDRRQAMRQSKGRRQ
jgi:hypothetical protein